MHGDDAPLDKLRSELQKQIDELRREQQEQSRRLMAISEMIEDRDQH